MGRRFGYQTVSRPLCSVDHPVVAGGWVWTPLHSSSVCCLDGSCASLNWFRLCCDDLLDTHEWFRSLSRGTRWLATQRECVNHQRHTWQLRGGLVDPLVTRTCLQLPCIWYCSWIPLFDAIYLDQEGAGRGLPYAPTLPNHHRRGTNLCPRLQMVRVSDWQRRSAENLACQGQACGERVYDGS